MQPGKEWIRQTNVYEVNLRQYSEEGTINAFIKHLPRLRKMGVHTLWFMPITPIAQLNKKGPLGSYYACSSYSEVDAEFGTLADFQNLVKEAHALGFKVILDWVANHTGWDHEWTISHPEWFEYEADGSFRKASGMDDIIELDFTNSAMRKEMINCMKFWVNETGIDGFRCDLAFWVDLDFWIEAKNELDKTKQLFWLAEADAWEHPEYMQVFDAAYTWKWMRAAEQFYQHGGRLSQLLDVLHHYSNLKGIPAWFTTNHDENSWNGTEYEKYGDAALLLAVFSCTWPGIPLVYSGQEIPNSKRLEFFEKDALQWPATPELENFYSILLTLQSTHEALHVDAACNRIYTSSDEQVLVFMRSTKEKAVLVFLNFSPHKQRLDIYDQRAGGMYRDIFTGDVVNLDQRRMMDIPAWGYLVLHQ
jgi:alpha-amylase